MRHGYHSGRTGTNTTRRGAKFWYVSNGRLKGVSVDRCGGRLYLGVELEVDGFRSDSYACDVTDYVDSKLGQYAQCVYDGSLYNGFEIVFDPMTLKAYALIRPIIEEVMQHLTDCGGHAHDSSHCGLHVHVSRAALGTTAEAKDLAIGKILEISERFMQSLSCFARRDIANTMWCSPTRYGHRVSDSSRTVRRKSRTVQDRQGICVHDDRRYHVWNFQNENTIECRAFKSTLKASTFYATLALVDGLVRFCTLKTTPEVHETNFDQVVAWTGDADAIGYWADRCSRLSQYTAYAA